MAGSKVKSLIVWILSIIGVVIAFLLWKDDKEVMKWAYAMLSLVVVWVVALALFIIPILGWIAGSLIYLVNFLVWLYGIYLIIAGKEFNVPVYRDIVKAIAK
jgi:uncharacterized membrane protein